MSDLISRQAAIDELSQRYIIMDNPHYIGYNAGLDEAQKVIKALPPVYVPVINVGDMISRDAATAAIYKLCNDFDTDNPHIDAIIDILDNLPPVQTEIIHCKDCLYKKICSWKSQGATFCSFGERGKAE